MTPENHFYVLSVKRVLVKWATSRNTKQLIQGENHFSALTDLAEWNIARNTRSSIHVNQHFSALTFGKSFSRLGPLTSHQRIHSGEKSLFILNVEKAFNTSSD